MNFSELKRKPGFQKAVLSNAQAGSILGGNGGTNNGSNTNPVDPNYGIGIIDTDII